MTIFQHTSDTFKVIQRLNKKKVLFNMYILKGSLGILRLFSFA